MKKVIIASFFVVVSMITVQRLFAVEVKVDNKFGGMTYYQDQSTVDSKWIGFFYESVLSVGHYEEEGLIGGAAFGIPVSAEAEEEWSKDSVKANSYDMSVSGFNANFELGYAFPTIIVSDLEIGFSPLAAYGFDYLKFDRQNEIIPNQAGRVTEVPTADEEHWLHHFDFGGKLYWFASDKLIISMKGMVGFIVYNTNDNDQTGKLTGNNGYLVRFETGADYFFTSNLALNLDAFADLYHIEGATSGQYTWPDADFNKIGGKFGLKYIF